MSRPFTPRTSSNFAPLVRVNGKIRAREVRVIGFDNQQMGVMTLNDAISLARRHGVDLVEVAPNATPPVCRVIDFGKYRYEQSKKEKESKKHQHANKVKEIQLSATIDPHDFGVKLAHAIDFLCDEMKVKLSLRFRGREMAHQEFGFKVVNNFIKDTAPYGHADSPPKLNGRSINVMLSPHPRNKRAKNPRETSIPLEPMRDEVHDDDDDDDQEAPAPQPKSKGAAKQVPINAAEQPSNFGNNAFSKLNITPEDQAPPA